MKRNTLFPFIIFIIMLSACKTDKTIVLSPQEKSSARIIYEKARTSIKRNPDRARLLFKEIMQLFPDSIYAQRSKIGIADSYFQSKDSSSLILAANEYQEYVNLFPNSPDAVYAKYQIGMCYYKQMRSPGRDPEFTKKTIQAFESMINQYPDTKQAEEAKKNITKARQAMAIHIFRIGRSNYKLKAYPGAVTRFKEVINNYPDFKENDKLFYYTGKSYFKMRDLDSSLSFFQKIINSYPKSKFFKPSTKMIKKIHRKTTLNNLQ